MGVNETCDNDVTVLGMYVCSQPCRLCVVWGCQTRSVPFVVRACICSCVPGVLVGGIASAMCTIHKDCCTIHMECCIIHMKCCTIQDGEQLQTHSVAGIMPYKRARKLKTISTAVWTRDPPHIFY